MAYFSLHVTGQNSRPTHQGGMSRSQSTMARVVLGILPPMPWLMPLLPLLLLPWKQVSDVRHQGKLLLASIRRAMRRGAPYGTYVSSAVAGAAQQAPAQHPQRDECTGSTRRRAASLASTAPQSGSSCSTDDAAGATATNAATDLELGGVDGVDAGCCPVCHEALSDAVRLECSHVYCADCICEWLERHRTCPMCRAEVAEAVGAAGHTDGISSLLPVLF